jgi:hypothetical protein
MLAPVPRAQPRKLATTKQTNPMADAINALGQLFHVGSGQDERLAMVLVRVRITSAATGGGKYNGRILNPPVTGISPTSSLSNNDLGDDPGFDNALILNAQEVGAATHLLTDPSMGVSNFIGVFYHYSTDGLAVVMINGIDLVLCDS